MAFINQYRGSCNHPGCGQNVPERQGFITKVAGRWLTWCRAHSPESCSTERKLTADGRLLTPFEEHNLNIVRSFPGAFFDRNANPPCWRVSLADADRKRVLDLADQLKLDVAPELRNVVVTNQAVVAEVAGLYPFQVTGVNWLAQQPAALLGDEMGLGKTIQSLVALPKGERILVVCPASLKYNWRDEAKKWRPDYVVTVINGNDNVRSPKKNEILILNFDILPDFLVEPSRKKGQDWKGYNAAVQTFYNGFKTTMPDLCECLLIVDEAHKVKGLETKRGMKIRTLANICKKVWGLTGTPLLNKAMDLWGVLTNLNLTRRAFGNAQGEYAWPNFKRMFNCSETYNRFARKSITTWGMPTTEVPERMRRVMLQRRRTEVMPDLPTKTYTDIIVSLGDVKGGSRIQKQLDSLWDAWDENKKEDLPAFTEMSEIRAKLAEACIPAMLEYVENCEEQDVRLVVASAHLAPLDALLDRPQWAIISGVTSPEDRQRISVAQREGSLNVACSINAAGVGLTLTGASRMLFVDLDWVPANNWQMEDRICRIGQTANKCEIVRFVVDHPLVRHIHKLLAKKMALIEAAINNKAEAQVTEQPVSPTGKRFLGNGKSRDFVHLLQRGEIALEEGNKVFAIAEGSFCRDCDGCGCKSCKNTGIDRGYEAQRVQKVRQEQADEAARQATVQTVVQTVSSQEPEIPF